MRHGLGLIALARLQYQFQNNMKIRLQDIKKAVDDAVDKKKNEVADRIIKEGVAEFQRELTSLVTQSMMDVQTTITERNDQMDSHMTKIDCNIHIKAHHEKE